MAFEQLKELGERAAARVQHLRHAGASGPRDADDAFGRPAVVEIELFEDRPVAERQVVARERISVDVYETEETRLVTDERRVEHVEMEAEGNA